MDVHLLVPLLLLNNIIIPYFPQFLLLKGFVTFAFTIIYFYVQSYLVFNTSHSNTTSLDLPITFHSAYGGSRVMLYLLVSLALIAFSRCICADYRIYFRILTYYLLHAHLVIASAVAEIIHTTILLLVCSDNG